MYVMLGSGYVIMLMNIDYDKVCVPPVPHVRRLVLRLNLHDPGRDCGEIHRRVSTTSVQVK